MGTYHLGPLGDFTGKISTVVGTTWRGKAVMLSLPNKTTNTPTTAKQLQRDKFKTVINFLNPLKELLNLTFGDNTQVKTPFNNATSYHLKEAVVNVDGTYMMKIRDFAVLRHIFGSGILGNSTFRAQKNLHNKILRYTNKRSNENDYLRSFFLAFKELKESNDLPKTPIFLYKLNESTNTFEKVNLNVQDNPVTLPCN